MGSAFFVARSGSEGTIALPDAKERRDGIRFGSVNEI